MGGAIAIQSDDTLIENCNFKNNAAEGPIFTDNNGNQRKPSGGAIGFIGGNNCTVNNCNFTGNNAAYNGGAIGTINANAINLTISNCIFINNTAEDGGSIYTSGPNGIVDKCQFTENTATGNGNKNGGGAIYWTGANGTVKDSNFTGNNATSRGGAIYLRGDSPNIVDSNFYNNSALGYRGGALFFECDNGDVINCNFTNNTAIAAGAIYTIDGLGNDFTYSGCNFINNTATTGNGGGLYTPSGKNVIVDDCKFINNTAVGDAGGLYFKGQNETLSNSYFENNHANGKGGALSANDCNISNTTFVNNSAHAGSAINVNNENNRENINITDSYFKDNEADSRNLTGECNNYTLKITFTGEDDYINAILASQNAAVTFKNVTYWDVVGMVNSDNVTPQRKFTEDDENITLEIYKSNNVLVDNVTGITDSEGQITYDYSKLPVGNYTYKAYHLEDTYYTYRDTTGNFSVNKYNITVNNNKTSKTLKNKNITINATITEYQNETITLPDNTKLVFNTTKNKN